MINIGCGGILIKENSVLLIKRKNSETFNDLWSNPGGKVEEDESLEDACIRELYEELGINVKIRRKLSEYEDYVGDNLFGIYTGYHVEIIEGQPRNNEPNKIAEVKYWPLTKLPTNIVPYTLQYLGDLGLV